ncbi:Hypothetical predicted protein [Mytilus galloprovincialis]|uniref:Uncharacterized protein n=1 Tax=Mytilus galloprovincialis TaxID=29158 RepID=A0A8B6EKZ4_MYTGA|nr:Hypothetical predicted protein [Mytilus galloprovincialis]
MNDIIHKLGQSVAKEVKIAAVKRLNPRFHGKPGLVKMSLENTDQKILILRNKHKLKTDENYKTVFIQGAKSRIERLIENNTRAILRELPQGNQFRLTGNGRIFGRKTQNNEDSEVDVPINHIDEMNCKIPVYDASRKTRKRHKSSKPFWNEELGQLWNAMRLKEKQFLSFKGRSSTRRRFREEFQH